MIVTNIATSIPLLKQMIESEIDAHLGYNFKEVNKMQVKVIRAGEIIFDHHQKQIRLTLPLDFIIKKGEGIFTSEVNGSINLDLGITYDISSSLEVNFESQIISYQWIKEPRLEIGSLDISLEKLADLVIKYSAEGVLQSINAKLKPLLNLQRMIDLGIENFEGEANKDLPSELRIDFDIKEIFLSNPIIENNILLLKGAVLPAVMITSSGTKKTLDPMATKFRWVDNLESSPLGFVDVQLMYADICKVAISHINGKEFGGKKIKIDSLSISGSGNLLKINISIESPIKGKAVIQFNPFFNESDGKLYLKDLDINITPDSIFHKLGAPIFSTFMESKINDFFPFDVNTFIRDEATKVLKNTKKIGFSEIKTQLYKLLITEMKFHFEYIEARVRYEGVIVDITNEALGQVS
jgi:hypothetical protein